uniref:guanylate-binding protein 2-like n=1 Tax=Myxine glutinosa TaxID=7769 RepID=UPI00358EE1DD
MDSPLMLISSDTNGKFVLNEDTAGILRGITKPVVVVAIVGRYRTGKSYLMNLLAGHKTGFALGHTVQSHTKGIWAWALPHPSDQHKYLLLLDTEGLGDVEKGSSTNDMSLFVMALLLSSQLVFNTTSVLSKDGLDQLQLVINLADHLKTKTTQSDDERGSDFDEYLPGLVVCIRDFTLQMEINGKPCTADGYLNHCLGLRKKGNTRECRSFNEQRELLEQYFPNRRCLAFPPPASPEDMQHLENISEDQINQRFLKTADDFKKFVLLKTPVKNIQGTVMNGKRFVALASQYVEAQRKGAIPCIEDATTSITSAANKEALEESTELYKQCMEAIKTSLPLSTHDLGAEHGRAAERAVILFKENSVLDREHKYEEELNKTLMKEYETWLQINDQTSTNLSEKRLAELYQPLKERHEGGEFECGGAYKRYKEELDAITEAFHSTQGLGEQAIPVLMNFLIERNKDSNYILSIDKMMDEQEKLQQEQEARDRLLEEQNRVKEEEQNKRHAEIIRTMQEQNEMLKEELDKKKKDIAELTQKQVDEVGANRKMKTMQKIVEGMAGAIPMIALAFRRG